MTLGPKQHSQNWVRSPMLPRRPSNISKDDTLILNIYLLDTGTIDSLFYPLDTSYFPTQSEVK